MIDILTIMRGQSEAERYPFGPIIERETGMGRGVEKGQ